jgi:hypothetical protein
MRRLLYCCFALTAVPLRLAWSAESPLVLAVIGDYGNCDSGGHSEELCADPETSEVRVAAMVKSWHPDAIFTTGDNSYVAGSTAEVTNDQRPYKEFLARGAFFPSWGNHDWGHHIRHHPSLDASFTYFGMQNYFYTHEFPGLLTAFLLDTNPEDPSGDTAKSKQADWFRAELQKSTTPWNITFNHQPPYVSCGHESSKEFRWLLEPKIDAVFSGHSHVYERLIEPNTAGTGTLTCVVVGTSGAELNKLASCRKHPEKGQQKVIVEHHGALKLEVTAHTLTGTFYTLDGGAQDSFTLTKR